MNAKQEAINLINELSEDQINKVTEFISNILKGKEKERLTAEQKELLGLLNATVNTGRRNFAEKHDHYIYGEK